MEYIDLTDDDVIGDGPEKTKFSNGMFLVFNLNVSEKTEAIKAHDILTFNDSLFDVVERSDPMTDAEVPYIEVKTLPVMNI
jgi:hypothetical protein